MGIEFSPLVDKELKKIKKKNKPLAKQIENKLARFAANPGHPSLRIHKLTGKLEDVRSLSVNANFRMLYRTFSGGRVVFFNLGTHDQIYREN